MRKVLLAAVIVAATLPSGVAEGHSNGCHSAHSCPSDHHTYVWYDGAGRGWSCARPGSDSYDPSRDTTTITYDGYTYYCYQAGSLPPPPPVDSDYDGVPDASDACPATPATTANGCPVAQPPRGYRAVRTSNGLTTAELSYIESRNGTVRSMRIKILRGGRLLYDDRALRPCPFSCRGVGPSGLNKKPIRIRDLDGDGEPEVFVDFWTGGANCCTLTAIFGFRPTTLRYERDQKTWGTGYLLRDLDRDGRLEFYGADRRFKYAFGCGACAQLPPRVWQYQQGTIGDVTRQHPKTVRRVARRHYRLYRRVRARSVQEARAQLASYVADLCLLGRCRKGLRLVNRLHRRGELRKGRQYDYPPYGRAYVRKLKRVLRRWGYVG